MKVSYESANKLLAYNPDTGLLRWKPNENLSLTNNSIAGKIYENGYVTLVVLGRLYQAHQLAWLLHYGEYAENQIDHINRNKADNRICNLRDVDVSTNCKNTGMRSNNKTGVCGVSLHIKGNYWRWQASININKQPVSLYRGQDLFEAVCARKAAEIKYDYYPVQHI